jgi:hypothetical protein
MDARLNAGPEWQAGSMAVAQQKVDGGLTTRGLCSKCRVPIGDDRRPSQLRHDPQQSRADKRFRLSSMTEIDIEVTIGS